MIRYIEGTIVHMAPQGIVILTAGIGYYIRTLKRNMYLSGEVCALHTYLAVRETALDLYGFGSQLELEFFELLLTIPKIGPKSALQILDQAELTLLLESINIEDAAHLSKLSGIGKKTAENIVNTLKGKIDVFNVATSNTILVVSASYQDAFDTLITLGYSPINIKKVLDKLPSTDTTSILVKTALQALS